MHSHSETDRSTRSNSPTTMNRWQTLMRWLVRFRWPVGGLLLATILIYGRAVTYQFLNWDDCWYIEWNALIKSWHPANLFGILTETVSRNYAPATISTFLVEHTLWQLWPGGYHATNVCLHFVNALLVFQLIRQLIKDDWLAWGVAALFLVHPVQVESVAWVSSRKTLLSATFMLASFLCWLRPDRDNRMEGWGILWLVLALLSKASAVIVPPIVVAYDVLVAKKKLPESCVRQLLPMLFCSLLVLITMNSQVTGLAGIRGHFGLSKLHLLGVDCTLLWRYVGMLLWPSGLCVLYDPPVHGITLMMIAAALGWLGLAAALWRVRDSHPLLTLAGITWILLLLPVLNLFPLTTLMNDRYLYLPCVPFFAVIGGMGQRLWRRIIHRFPALSPTGNLIAATVSSALIGMASWGTLSYLPVWKDPVSLWSYARIHAPTLSVVHVQWAVTLESLERYDEATQALQYALNHCHPDAPEQRTIDMLLNRIEEARQQKTLTLAESFQPPTSVR